MDINNLKIIPDGDKLTLLEGKAPKPLDPYDYQGFQYETISTKSFATLVKEKGAQSHAVIFANDKGFKAILDDTVKDRMQDTVKMDYRLSTKCKEWEEILTKGKIFNIKQLVDFLKRRDDNEIDGLADLIFAIKNFKYVSNISGDFTFDSRNNYTFAVKVNEVDGTVRIPTSIFTSIEIFKDSGWNQTMEIEIEIEKPKEAGEQPLFLLTCPKWERYFEKAKENEAETLVRELGGWLIVDGYPNQK